MKRNLFLLVALACLGPQGLEAQRPDTIPSSPPLAASVAGGVLGSTAGALLGMGAGAALGSQRGDYIEAYLWGILIGGAAGSVLGSAGGTHLVARAYGDAPSMGTELLAATLGAFAGALAGAALVQVSSGDVALPFMLGFTITQGTLTAFGSQHSMRRR